MHEITAIEWENFLGEHPKAHLLQSTAWGALKAAFGWKVLRVLAGETGCQLLLRPVLPGFNLAYLPKGPVGANWAELWPAVDQVCKENRCIMLKVEPDTWLWREGMDEISSSPPPGFVSSPQSVQPLRTIVVSLEGEENKILFQMKQKTRYNINLALKKGVIVRPTDDINIFYDLVQETGQRDQFGVHSRAYYQRAYELFHPQCGCELLLAESESQPLAALMVFASGKRAWYLYGASADRQRDRMPNYLLQWEAMRWARSQGCIEYDLWGVPDASLETLEADFTTRKEGLWGVYRFKRGFGGELRRTDGPWDRIYSPSLYRLYRLWLKVRRLDAA